MLIICIWLKIKKNNVIKSCQKIKIKILFSLNIHEEVFFHIRNIIIEINILIKKSLILFKNYDKMTNNLNIMLKYFIYNTFQSKSKINILEEKKNIERGLTPRLKKLGLVRLTQKIKSLACKGLSHRQAIDLAFFFCFCLRANHTFHASSSSATRKVAKKLGQDFFSLKICFFIYFHQKHLINIINNQFITLKHLWYTFLVWWKLKKNT